ECKLKNTCFEACNLSQVDFLHTSLKGIDLTSNTLHGLSLTGALELRGAVVNLFQAAELAKLLGVIIKD
ncbi:MAG: pentapeptide repeat-containing protein, partial [Eubacterium sp.]